VNLKKYTNVLKSYNGYLHAQHRNVSLKNTASPKHKVNLLPEEAVLIALKHKRNFASGFSIIKDLFDGARTFLRLSIASEFSIPNELSSFLSVTSSSELCDEYMLASESKKLKILRAHFSSTYNDYLERNIATLGNHTFDPGFYLPILNDVLPASEDEYCLEPQLFDQTCKAILLVHTWCCFLKAIGTELPQLISYQRNPTNTLPPEVYTPRKNPIHCSCLFYGFAFNRFETGNTPAMNEFREVNAWVSLITNYHIPYLKPSALPLLADYEEYDGIILGVITSLLHWFSMPIGSSFIQTYINDKIPAKLTSLKKMQSQKNLPQAIPKQTLEFLKSNPTWTIPSLFVSQLENDWFSVCPKIQLPWKSYILFPEILKESLDSYVFEHNDKMYTYLYSEEFV
jgi:hypothetical protein